MTARFHLRLHAEEGVLSRLLGAVRRREAEVLSIAADRRGASGGYEVRLTLRSDRSLEVLARQIAKLEEVEGIDWVQSEDMLEV